MNAFLTIPGFEEFCQQALGVLADSTAKGAILLLLAWAIALAMKRASAAARHLVWALALGGLLMLPVLSLALPKWQLPILPRRVATAPAIKPTIESAPAPSIAEPLKTALATEMKNTILPPHAPITTAPFAVAATAPTLSKPLSVSAILVAAWLAMALVVLVPLGAGFILVRNIINKSARLDREPWPEFIESLSNLLSLRRKVRLYLSSGPTMPMAVGIFRSAIVLPAEAETWPDEKGRAVLLHELAHVRRWDCLTHILTRLACVMHWFNPLAWLALNKLQNERERACDDLALTAGTRPTVYANELLSIARAMHSGPATSTAAIPMARTSQLEGRLLAILDAARNRGAVTNRILGIATVFLLMIVSTLAVVQLTSAEAQPNTSDTAVVIINAIVDDSLAAKIRQQGESVATDSKNYAAWRCNGANLLSVLRASLDSPNQDIYVANRTKWIEPGKNGFSYADTFADETKLVGLSMAGFYRFIPVRGGAELDITGFYVGCNMDKGRVDGKLRFGGNVNAGDALLFMGGLGPVGQAKPVHLCI